MEFQVVPFPRPRPAATVPNPVVAVPKNVGETGLEIPETSLGTFVGFARILFMTLVPRPEATVGGEVGLLIPIAPPLMEFHLA